MIAGILRTETAKKHEALESLMFINEIMNNSLSLTNYKKLLTINYIIHQKLENKLADMLNKDLADELEINGRLKLNALEKDLNYWQIDRLTLPSLNFDLFIPQKNTAEIMGTLYVLEGATLGGNVIKKHILANPNFKDQENGLNYYGVYGPELGAKWKSFVTILNDRVKAENYQRCVDSANQTFENLIQLSKQIS
ncbi:hypothetical protein GJU39_07000 [Pedobacter petrophilus]|uniref:Heme oxygenase n=1 Tax=Pedobacter petrophilus TaxID=1908241 RepID=A0A7K0FWV3_9SPHI|nr:biliverdin-producing heme oxygenase [Pedobacter petrophilus]MRX75832.1 hypothetical protein [Pedobacter petrophilus]